MTDPHDVAQVYDQVLESTKKVLDDLVRRGVITGYAESADGGWTAPLAGQGPVVRLHDMGEAIVFAIGVAAGVRLAGGKW
jgi:hypothetical protein